MKVTLVNHSSLLLKFKNSTILTDFWNTSPAFGSWLPSALPFYHPTYLASLSFEDNFYLTISHAHDDHLDEYNRDIIMYLDMFGYKYKNSKN